MRKFVITMLKIRNYELTRKKLRPQKFVYTLDVVV